MTVSQERLGKYSVLRAKTYSSEDIASLLKKYLAVYTESWSQHCQDKVRTMVLHDKIPKPESNSTAQRNPEGAAYPCYVPTSRSPALFPSLETTNTVNL